MVNSSFDFSRVTFSSDSGGIITCDSSSVMVSDLTSTGASPIAGVHCTTPHALGNRRVNSISPTAPDMSAASAAQAQYKKVATKHWEEPD